MTNLTWPYDKLALNIFIQKTNWVLRRNIQDYGCNCSKKNECPMQNMCLKPNIIYEATVTNNTDIVKKYISDYGKRTVTILDLSGYNVIVKIKNYLNMYVD